MSNRPKPSALKRIEGNRGKRRFNEKEPKAEVGAPEMPKLSREAAKEWRRIVPVLLRIGVLTVLDGKALAAYCHAYARWLQAERDVKRYGVTIREPVLHNGRVLRSVVRLKRNPALGVSSDALKLMKSFLIEFGLTPAARSRVVSNLGMANAQTPRDAADEFFSDTRSNYPVQ